jgi:prevent-host-death family protein
MSVWQLQTAKAKLSELLRAVREHGPQIISVRGREEFVVTQKQPAASAAAENGLELFRPVLGLGVELELPPRDPEGHRKLWFEDEDALLEDEIADFTKPR